MYREETVQIIDFEYKTYMRLDGFWYEYSEATGGWWNLDNMTKFSYILDTELEKHEKKQNAFA